jgi:hypothetical protein
VSNGFDNEAKAFVDVEVKLSLGITDKIVVSFEDPAEDGRGIAWFNGDVPIDKEVDKGVTEWCVRVSTTSTGRCWNREASVIVLLGSKLPSEGIDEVGRPFAEPEDVRVDRDFDDLLDVSSHAGLKGLEVAFEAVPASRNVVADKLASLAICDVLDEVFFGENFVLDGVDEPTVGGECLVGATGDCPRVFRGFAAGGEVEFVLNEAAAVAGFITGEGPKVAERVSRVDKSSKPSLDGLGIGSGIEPLGFAENLSRIDWIKNFRNSIVDELAEFNQFMMRFTVSTNGNPLSIPANGGSEVVWAGVLSDEAANSVVGGECDGPALGLWDVATPESTRGVDTVGTALRRFRELVNRLAVVVDELRLNGFKGPDLAIWASSRMEVSSMMFSKFAFHITVAQLPMGDKVAMAVASLMRPFKRGR